MLIALCTILHVPSVHADNWRTHVKDLYLPSHLVCVDKERQKFFFYEKKSPLKLKYEFPCTTGQRHGDKQIINDLKTPEGIYFVEYKIASGLDFREYGGVAYTLNYPNPVDRLRGKTGHGIWIHSKGFGLVPTKGCVAIGLQEIDTVGPQLTPGTAVILAEGMSQPDTFSREEKNTAQQLRSLMQSWSQAWSMRSAKMFDYYDQDAYTKATEDFQSFKNNKERIFKMVQNINLFNRDIHVLEGPGYWVTWAEQCYTASNHTSEGIRRLYWQRDADKRFRIVGMEWLPRDIGMLAEYKKGQLVAQAPQTVASDALERLQLPSLDMPEDAPAAEIPAKGKRQLVAVSDPLVPSERASNTLSEFNWTDMEGRERKPASLAAEQEEPQPAQEDPKDAVVHASERFLSLLGQHSEECKELFSQASFNRVAGVVKQRSLKRTIYEIDTLLAKPNSELISHLENVEQNQDLCITRFSVLIVDQNTPFEGEYKFFWKQEPDDTWKIVGLNFFPRSTNLYAAWLEKITKSVNDDIELWRKAWEKASVDEYIACYTENALQQGRRGRDNIKRQKALLWTSVKPVSVAFTGLRVMPNRKGIQVDMTQIYKDSTGKTESGLKVLLLEREGDHWKIAQEDWRPLPKTATR